MIFMVVGDGCREYAIAKRLISEDHKVVSFQVKRNWGLERICQSWHCSREFEPTEIIAAARSDHAEVIVAGTEKAIFRGLSDACNYHHIPCYAPLKSAAQLEENKLFAKEFVDSIRPDLVGPFRAIQDLSTAEEFIDEHGPRVVLKCRSAMCEFGVKVFCSDAGAAMAGVRDALRSGLPLLIEKYIDGKDFTQYCFTDGLHSFFPRVIRDFPFRSETVRQKTGGMGSINFGDILPDINPMDTANAQDCIKRVLHQLDCSYGIRFRGVLAGQFIKSSQSLFFNEFDVRPGDSEFVNILASLDSPLSEIILNTLTSNLNNIKINASNTVCVYHVPVTYPGSIMRQQFTLPEWSIESRNVLFGNIIREGHAFSTGPGRTLLVSSTAYDFSSARREAVTISDALDTGLCYRRDIGRAEEVALNTSVE